MHRLLCTPASRRRPGGPRVRRGTSVGVLASVALAAALAGCAESMPTAALPDLVKDPRKFLSKEEQQQAIDDLSQKKAAQGADSEKQGEKPK